MIDSFIQIIFMFVQSSFFTSFFIPLFFFGFAYSVICLVRDVISGGI